MATIDFPSQLGCWVRNGFTNTEPQARGYLGARIATTTTSSLTATFFMTGETSVEDLLDWWEGTANYGFNSFNVTIPFFNNTPTEVMMMNDLHITNKGYNVYEAIFKFIIPVAGVTPVAPPSVDGPTAIIDLVASDALEEKVIITFTDPDSIQPVTYDLYGGGLLLATNITSGYEDVFTGTRDYYILATNTGGSTQSNIDSGTGAITGEYLHGLIYNDTNIGLEFT